MSPRARKLLLGSFFALVLPLGIYAAYVNLQLATDVAERIQRDCLDPYRADLAAERWAEARARWTEEGRARHDEAAFVGAHAAHRRELGAPDALEVQSVSEVHPPGQPSHYEVRAMWLGSEGQRAVAYDVREVEGVLLIDRAYTRPPSGPRTPAIH